jgi:hypothetical protein
LLFPNRLLQVRRGGQHFLLVSMLSAFTLLLSDGVFAFDRFTISISDRQLLCALTDRNRITQYTVSVWAGRVVGMLRIEEDWHIEVNNDQRPQIKAFAGHGAGWLTADDVRMGAFRDFIVIEVRPDWGALDVKVDLAIDVFMKEEENHILIEKKDMVITPLKK